MVKASKKSSGKRNQETVKYTTELQRRKRKELLTLRQEAQRLNTLLVPLLQRRQDHWASALDVTGGVSNGWRSLASIECEERRRAERTNGELKAILADQEKIRTAIQRLLRRQSTFEGREFVLQLQPAIERSPCRLDYSQALIGELASAENENNCAIISRSQDTRHAMTGRRIAETYTFNRVVVVGLSTWYLPTGGVQFEDKTWTVISPTQSNPQHSCVVRTRYELQAKVTDTASVLPTDLTQVEDAIMSGIGGKLRNAMQAMQNSLLNEIEFG
eukprot:jgi/Phyca11/4461/fgenesh1_pm.PHYCAscaffold_2_\